LPRKPTNPPVAPKPNILVGCGLLYRDDRWQVQDMAVVIAVTSGMVVVIEYIDQSGAPIRRRLISLLELAESIEPNHERWTLFPSLAAANAYKDADRR